MASNLLVRAYSSTHYLTVGLRAVCGRRDIHFTSCNEKGARERRIAAYTLGVTHSWPSRGGVKANDVSLLQDLYIRKFIFGTFAGVEQTVIQKKANCIDVTFWLNMSGYRNNAPSLYFLTSYSETILSRWLACKVSIIIRGWYKEVKTI